MDTTNTATQVTQPLHAVAADFSTVFLESWLPFILLIAVYMYFMRQMKKGGKFQSPMQAQLDEMNATLKEISQKLDKR